MGTVNTSLVVLAGACVLAVIGISLVVPSAVTAGSNHRSSVIDVDSDPDLEGSAQTELLPPAQEGGEKPARELPGPSKFAGGVGVNGDLARRAPRNQDFGYSDLARPVPYIDPKVVASRQTRDVECPEAEMPLHMKDRDKAFFRKTMKDAAAAASAQKRSFLYSEFGSGGSTVEAASFGATVFSFESAAVFCPTVTKQAAFQCYEREGRIFYFCLDVQRKLKMWSSPAVNTGVFPSFHRYVNAIDRIGVRTLDVVFVDGRFRIACALKALLYLVEIEGESRIVPRGDDLGLLIVHDYHRSKYAEIEKHYDVVKRADELVVLRPKQNLSFEALSQYLRYLDDPD
mmetsp:Transcript_13296/g.28869  ORF Transcript_13296/g.28869 Transcript_13296/m.28869 type:complete len:343 (-) Transcript_13296:211-1239(-)